ncbi:hypothetical protein BGW42_002534 [Actinomortierella wolfii]|nr:hypothetical protein BGW42_002534 [Actinomortierella wolfii]
MEPFTDNPPAILDQSQRPPHPLSIEVDFTLFMANDDDDDQLHEFLVCAFDEDDDDDDRDYDVHALVSEDIDDSDPSGSAPFRQTINTTTAMATDESDDEEDIDEEDDSELSYLEVCKKYCQPIDATIGVPLYIQVLLRNHHLTNQHQLILHPVLGKGDFCLYDDDHEGPENSDILESDESILDGASDEQRGDGITCSSSDTKDANNTMSSVEKSKEEDNVENIDNLRQAQGNARLLNSAKCDDQPRVDRLQNSLTATISHENASIVTLHRQEELPLLSSKRPAMSQPELADARLEASIRQQHSREKAPRW